MFSWNVFGLFRPMLRDFWLWLHTLYRKLKTVSVFLTSPSFWWISKAREMSETQGGRGGGMSIDVPTYVDGCGIVGPQAPSCRSRPPLQRINAQELRNVGKSCAMLAVQIGRKAPQTAEPEAVRRIQSSQTFFKSSSPTMRVRQRE